MITFQFLDWLWLALFVLLMVFFGFYFYRFGKRSQSDYFLADRGLPWWLPASSVYATHTATDTPIWVAGVVYKYGFAGLWYSFYSAWCAISAYVSTRIFRRSLAYSQAEWQTLRFGELGAELLRGWLAGRRRLEHEPRGGLRLRRVRGERRGAGAGLTLSSGGSREVSGGSCLCLPLRKVQSS